MPPFACGIRLIPVVLFAHGQRSAVSFERDVVLINCFKQTVVCVPECAFFGEDDNSPFQYNFLRGFEGDRPHDPGFSHIGNNDFFCTRSDSGLEAFGRILCIKAPPGGVGRRSFPLQNCPDRVVVRAADTAREGRAGRHHTQYETQQRETTVEPSQWCVCGRGAMGGNQDFPLVCCQYAVSIRNNL